MSQPQSVFLKSIIWIIFFSGTNGDISQQCHLNEFKCDYDGVVICLKSEQVCDDVEDCSSGEDEIGNGNTDCTQLTLASQCRPNQFECRFGGCVARDKVCDSIPHCWGATDESLELCARHTSTTTVRSTTPFTTTRTTKRPLSTLSSPLPFITFNNTVRSTTSKPFHNSFTTKASLTNRRPYFTSISTTKQQQHYASKARPRTTTQMSTSLPPTTRKIFTTSFLPPKTTVGQILASRTTTSVPTKIPETTTTTKAPRRRPVLSRLCRINLIKQILSSCFMDI